MHLTVIQGQEVLRSGAVDSSFVVIDDHTLEKSVQ